MVRLIGATVVVVSQITLLVVWSLHRASGIRFVALVAAAIGLVGSTAVFLGAWRERKRWRGGSSNTDN